MWRWCATYHWKDLDEGYNFALDLTSIKGLHKTLWVSKVAKVLISRRQWYLGARSVARHQKYYKWEGGGFSQVWAIMNFKSMFAHGSSVHQKCFNYVLINLLFGLCKSMWIIYPLVTRPSPHPEALTHPSTPEVLRTKERTPTLYPSIVVFTLDSQLSLLRSLGVHQCISYLSFFGINNGMEFMFSIFWTFLKFW